MMLGISNMPYNPAKLALNVFPDEKDMAAPSGAGGIFCCCDIVRIIGVNR
jgi:hypothetical protein